MRRRPRNFTGWSDPDIRAPLLVTIITVQWRPVDPSIILCYHKATASVLTTTDPSSYHTIRDYEQWFLSFQFTHWVDAVVFVFSLENEISFNAIYSYYAKMAHFRNTAEVPIILVGTQGECRLRVGFIGFIRIPTCSGMFSKTSSMASVLVIFKSSEFNKFTLCLFTFALHR